jgi:hypothetical protein
VDDRVQDAPLDDGQVRWLAGVLLDRLARQQDEVEQLGRAAPGSPLAGDDRAAHPYEVSMAAYRALVTATEQLDALRALLVDARVVHPTAPYALVRAAIESGAAAVWLLVPTTRGERVVRSLQLMVGDALDGDRWRLRPAVLSRDRSRYVVPRSTRWLAPPVPMCASRCAGRRAPTSCAPPKSTGRPGSTL